MLLHTCIDVLSIITSYLHAKDLVNLLETNKLLYTKLSCGGYYYNKIYR